MAEQAQAVVIMEGKLSFIVVFFPHTVKIYIWTRRKLCQFPELDPGKALPWNGSVRHWGPWHGCALPSNTHSLTPDLSTPHTAAVVGDLLMRKAIDPIHGTIKEKQLKLKITE